jgi:polyhydroxyalkanoate synthesis regulator phasin
MDGKFAKQMIDFYKSTFDNSFNAMVMLQEQTEKNMKMALDQATWLPAEGKKVIDEWVKAYKQGRDEFKKVTEENFKKVEEFFNKSAQ